VKHPRGVGVVVEVFDHDWLGETYQELDVRLESGKFVRVTEEYVRLVVDVEEEA
jgi:hypothetical protein